MVVCGSLLRQLSFLLEFDLSRLDALEYSGRGSYSKCLDGDEYMYGTSSFKLNCRSNSVTVAACFLLPIGIAVYVIVGCVTLAVV